VPLEVRRSSDQHAPEHPQLPRNERRIHQRPRPDGDVETILHQIYHAVGADQVDLHVRVLLEERCHHRSEQTKGERRGDAEQAPRRGLKLSDCLVYLLYV